MADFNIKQGDTAPYIEVTLLDSLGNPSAEVTNSSLIYFRMRKDTADQGDYLINEPATVQNAAEARVAYVWAAGDTDEPGLYYSEWVLDLGSGLTQTFPADDFNIIRVTERL